MPGKKDVKQSVTAAHEKEQESFVQDGDKDEWEDDGEEDLRERKKRKDADQPRIWERDITGFRWMGEQ